MATNFLWGPVGTVQHLLTTELNALAVATLTAAGPEINNSSGYQQGLLYLKLASAAFVAGNFASIYFVPSNDTAGTTYPTATSAAAWAGSNYFVGNIYINGSTAAQNEMLFVPYIPLGKFKTYLLTGGACPTLGGTLNTLDLYPTPSQY
jgi:hypothetical protein